MMKCLPRGPDQQGPGDFPGGPVAKTLRSQCRGPGSDPWSGKLIPYAAIKEFACHNYRPTSCNEDQRFCMPQVRPGAAKQTHILKKNFIK